MAEIKKAIKQYSNITIQQKITPWFENKTQRIKTFQEHQAYRAAKRWGAPAGVALILFLTLYSFFLPKNQFQIAKENVLKNPKDLEAHLVLAEEFLKNNQLTEAKKELLTANNIEQTTNNKEKVLGLTSKLEDSWSRWREENPQELKKLIEKWEKVVSETPTYLDGWLYLSLYNFKLGNFEEAKKALEKAKELDPLNPTIQNLKNLLQQ